MDFQCSFNIPSNVADAYVFWFWCPLADALNLGGIPSMKPVGPANYRSVSNPQHVKLSDVPLIYRKLRGVNPQPGDILQVLVTLYPVPGHGSASPMSHSQEWQIPGGSDNAPLILVDAGLSIPAIPAPAPDAIAPASNFQFSVA